MNKALSVIVAALTFLTGQSMAQEQQEQKIIQRNRTVRIPGVPTKYDKMDKKHLQEELKRLVKAVPDAEQAAIQAEKDRKEARKAYTSASEEQKPDALLRMLEAEVKFDKLIEKLKQVEADFSSAQNAYRNLLYAEQE